MDAAGPENRGRIIDYICTVCGRVERLNVPASVPIDAATPHRICSHNAVNTRGDGGGDPDWCTFYWDIVDWAPAEGGAS